MGENVIEQTVMAQLAAVGAISNNALKKRYGYNFKKLRRTIGDSSGLNLDSLQMLQLIIGLEVELGDRRRRSHPLGSPMSPVCKVGVVVLHVLAAP